MGTNEFKWPFLHEKATLQNLRYTPLTLNCPKNPLRNSNRVPGRHATARAARSLTLASSFQRLFPAGPSYGPEGKGKDFHEETLTLYTASKAS
jgi:hypothetical protein